MQFSKLSLGALFTLLATAAVAAPAPDSVEARAAEPAADPALHADDLEVLVKRQGFGCPLNQERCHNHCRSISGYRGGYCEGILRQRCRCYT